MKKKRSIRRKITTVFLAVLMAGMILTGAVSMWSLYSMRNISTESNNSLGKTAAEDAEMALEDMAGEHLQALAVEKATYIEQKFDEVAAYLHGIAAAAEEIYAHPGNYPDRAVALPQVGSTTLAAQLMWSESLREPAPENWAELYKLGNLQDMLVQYNDHNDMVSSTYVATQSGWMIQADYIAFSKYEEGAEHPDFYEAASRQWYQRALLAEQGTVVYSDVIADVHSGSNCIVCARPIYYKEEVVAVAGVGSYLDTVNEAVLNTTIGGKGYAFLVNEKGQVMVSGKDNGETAANAETNADLRESGNTQLAKAVESMVSGNSGLCKLTVDGKEVYLAYAPLKGLHWSFVTVIDVEEVLAPARQSRQEILTLTESMAKKQEEAIRTTQMIYLAILVLSVGVISLVSVLFTGKLTAPIHRLTTEVADFNGGNLDHQIQIATGDEVEELGNAFNGMTAQLKSYIKNLAAATAEKERIQTELGLAAQIQADMLPDSEKILTDRIEFAIHAGMTPAKEVGGDFYDFFLTDENHLAFLIADVSGKGVPASLFMVVAKTLLRSHITDAESLAEKMEEVNASLCANNQNDMFVTAWAGILDLSTGVLTYVNAGHNPPLLKQKKDSYDYLKSHNGFVLAGMENVKYTRSRVRLRPGDTIFLYTDGVVEANNEAGKLYGEVRLRQLLSKNTALEPEQLAGEVWKSVRDFQGAAEQFDDITMLIIRYNGDGYETKTDAPNMGRMEEINQWIEEQLKRNGISQKTIIKIRMAVDEIYSNICYYSKAEEVTIGCKVTEQKEAVLYFEDDGIPYNPLKRPDPDVTLLMEERGEGGLGIYLVKKRMDKVEYKFVEGRNCLILTKRED
ncbi:MAG: SpoIIE family protein phosphatase [Lachnoclostridium sp.]|nr:SpoIIE family protein phosphatase [Lachnospira sp.]MCM1247712.1 SpoIIE family protein phosphatase [Lachnoclostridium sp.]MCM1535742.1 SpoIIE family protein phosphatase [Clostridium sp.]